MTPILQAPNDTKLTLDEVLDVLNTVTDLLFDLACAGEMDDDLLGRIQDYLEAVGAAPSYNLTAEGRALLETLLATEATP